MYFQNLSQRNVPSDEFKLLVNPTDKMLLDKAKAEIKNVLKNTRSALHIDEHEPVDAHTAFAAATPRHFIEQFHQYLLTTLEVGQPSTLTFKDIYHHS